jgi:putative spermidine/putrescine transport system substrate-binding protein
MKKTEKISAPAIGKTISLRVLGTDVTLTEAIRVQAAHDLGIDIQFDIMDGISAQQKAGIQPNSFDIFDQGFHSVDIVWLAKTVQPIDIRRVKLWGDVNDLTKVGLGSNPSSWISMLPTAHNVDSFAYDLTSAPEDRQAGGESWSWLLDDRFRGKVALAKDPAIRPCNRFYRRGTGCASFRIGQFRRHR